MTQPVIIAFLGKGGSGKSIISSLTAKLVIEKKKKVLLIDADPAMGLTTALDVHGYKTLGEVREKIIHKARDAAGSDGQGITGSMVDYLMMDALFERPDFSLIVMGQTNTIGCYCPVNTLLKETIKAIASQYDVVIIDGEAGIEQVSRQVTESVHYPLLLTDNSLRGVRTAILVNEAIKRSPHMWPQKTGVIFNRVEEAAPNLLAEISKSGLDYFGWIPADGIITQSDKKGLSPLGMTDKAVSFLALKNILSDKGIV